MAGETQITLVGNLTADPELRFTPSGAAVANFTVASTPRNFDRQTNEWRDGEAMFLNCAVWRQAAENVAESLTKGMRVIVQGRLRARSYDDREGNRRTVFEVEVDEVAPSLRYATAKVTKTSSGGGNWQNTGGGQSRGGSAAQTPRSQGGNPAGWSSGGPQGAGPQGPQSPGPQSSGPQGAGPQGPQGSGPQGGNRAPVADPWASAQSDEPPF